MVGVGISPLCLWFLHKVYLVDVPLPLYDWNHDGVWYKPVYHALIFDKGFCVTQKLCTAHCETMMFPMKALLAVVIRFTQSLFLEGKQSLSWLHWCGKQSVRIIYWHCFEHSFLHHCKQQIQEISCTFADWLPVFEMITRVTVSTAGKSGNCTAHNRTRLSGCPAKGTN